ncbi:MAG: hypothetical protein IJ006_02410 [Lachnospiraceae bacterium]|nr:hypothetical protein [Lachnospiraceae bacterium]
MAATKKNTSSGRRNTTAKRSASKSTSSAKKPTGKNQKKESQGPDLITIIVVLVAVVLVLVLVSKYKDEKKGGEAGNPTGTVSVTGTSVPDMPTPEGRPDTPTPTQSVTKEPKATATPVPTPTEEPVLSQTEALRIVNEIIQLENYSIELLDDHLMIDGAEYYSFCVNNEKGEGMEPLLIVEKKEGTLLCYDMTGVVAPIAKFPLDKTETGSDGQEMLTVEEAKTLLAGFTAERLGLAKEPSAYEMTADDWTTMADGAECYGINFFEETGGKQRFRGTFYVALDGSAVYGKDDVTGEFIKR